MPEKNGYLSLALVLGLILGSIIGCSGCQEESARIPRPRAYPRITFPERNYVDFQLEDCPLSFTYPDYMQIVKRENHFENEPIHPCWFDLDATALGATLHFSYYAIGPEKAFDGLVTDAFKMADRITQRANYMDEIRVANAQGISGIIMEFTGSAASPMHFYMSDSTAHFLKGSLYFRSKVVPDSLAPILDFLQGDIAEILNTLTFK